MTNKLAFFLNGPNLNLLGAREPEIYGHTTLADIEKAVTAQAKPNGWAIDFRQTNMEGALVDWIQEAGAKADGLVLNPGAYTHSSIAILDALNAISVPKIELHLSNIHAREEFRAKSVTAAGADGVIMGMGAAGYEIAFDALTRLLPHKDN